MISSTSTPAERPPLHAKSMWRLDIGQTLQLAWPLIVTNLVELALMTTNLVLVGELGPHYVASVTLANNLFYFFAIAAFGVAGSVAPLIASVLGSQINAEKEVRRTVQQGLWASALASVPGLLLLTHSEAIFLMFRQEPGIAAEAGRYMSGLAWALPPFIGYIALRSTASAIGHPGAALWAALGGIVINIALSWCLISGQYGFPALGAKGAGIGTAVATWSMFLLLAASLFLARPFRHFHLFKGLLRPDFQRLCGIFRLGIPIAITLMFESGIFYAAALLMGLVGTTDLAAYGIAIQIASISFMIPLGLSQAATVRVGRAYGAQDMKAVTHAGWTAYALGVGFMIMMAAVMLIYPYLLIGNFIDLASPANNEVISKAALFLVFAGLFQIADGAQVIAAGMLRGLHDTVTPMIVAGIGYWLTGLPAGVFLAFYMQMGGVGLWIGLIIGLSAVAILLTMRWITRGRLILRVRAG